MQCRNLCTKKPPYIYTTQVVTLRNGAFSGVLAPVSCLAEIYCDDYLQLEFRGSVRNSYPFPYHSDTLVYGLLFRVTQEMFLLLSSDVALLGQFEVVIIHTSNQILL